MYLTFFWFPKALGSLEWSTLIFLKSDEEISGSSRQPKHAIAHEFEERENQRAKLEPLLQRGGVGSKQVVIPAGVGVWKSGYTYRMGPPSYKWVYKPWNNPYWLVRYIYHKATFFRQLNAILGATSYMSYDPSGFPFCHGGVPLKSHDFCWRFHGESEHNFWMMPGGTSMA